MMILLRPLRILVAVLAAAVVAGCASPAPSRDGAAPPASQTPPLHATPSSTSRGPAPTDGEPPAGTGVPSHRPPPDPNVVIRPIPDGQWAAMVRTGTWRPGCPVGRADLVRMELDHYTFSGRISRGVLVVHRDVAASLSGIFTALFEARFPIRHMRPVEFYGGDAKASLADDNTSAFNCRRPDQINAPVLESPHANGRAIDINPWENPWIDLRCRCWFPTEQTKARRPGPGVIVKGGLVWRQFTRAGWIWQNIDVPDYMHFDTGYPSRPYRSPAP